MSTFRMADLIPLIQTEATKQGVDPNLALSIFVAENTADGILKPDARVSTGTLSPKGAFGLMQVMPATLQGLKAKGLIPPELNYATPEGQIAAGIAAIKDIQTQAGDDPLAVASFYNGGTKAFAAYQGSGMLNPETDGYLGKVSRSLGITWRGKRVPQDQSSALNSAVSGFNNAVTSGLDLMKNFGIEAAGITQRGREAQIRAGEAEAQTHEAAGQREIGQLERDARLLSIFSMDTTLQDSEAVKQAAALTKAELLIQQLKPKVDSDMASSPLENPVEWLGAQVRLLKTVPQYNSAVSSRENAVQALATRQQLMKQQQSLEPGVTANQVMLETRAKAELSRAQAAAKVADIDMNNLNLRFRMLQEEVSWRGQQAQLAMGNARMYMESIGISKDAEAKGEQQKTLDNVNMFLLGIGGQRIPTWSQFASMPAKERDKLLKGAISGGGTVGANIALIEEFNTMPNLQRRDPAMGDMVMKVFDAVKEPLKAARANVMNNKLSDSELLEKFVNDQVKIWNTELLGNEYNKLSDNNPWKMQANLYALNPELEGNGFAKHVREVGKNMPDGLTEKDISLFALGRLRAGESEETVVRELSEFFSKGYEYQFKAAGMGTLGFNPNHPKLKAPAYFVGEDAVVKQPMLGFSKASGRQYNLMNPVDVKNFLTYNFAKMKEKDRISDVVNKSSFLGGGATP